MNKLATRITAAATVALCTIAIIGSRPSENMPRFAELVPDDLLRTAPAFDGACGSNGEQTMISGISAPQLTKLYNAMQFDLDSVRDGEANVPKILLADLPSDLGDESVARRKALFLKAVLPAILVVDRQILDQRKFVKSVQKRMDRGNQPTAEQRARLDALAECYAVEPGDISGLLRRVDVVPPALGLAQAAIESRWGTSRFAQSGHAILGEHTTAKDGLAPKGLEKASFRVRSFGHLTESVGAFMRNLNTHPAYRGFRDARARLRHEQKPLDSIALAGTLLRYSERGRAYVDDVRAIIRSNHLEPFDDAQLADADAEPRGTCRRTPSRGTLFAGGRGARR